MPKQIFEITSFDGIDLSVSSEDTSNQAAFDVLNIDNARSLGNLTPIKNDTFLSRAGFTISKTSTGIDDDVYIIGMETINWHNDQGNKEETDLVVISAGDPFSSGSITPSIDVLMDIYGTDIDDLNLAGSDLAIPDTVTVPDGAGGNETITQGTDSGTSVTAGRTDLSMSEYTSSITKWNEALHIGTGNSSTDKTKWVGRMKHGFLDIYRDESGGRHPDYDTLGCLDSAVLAPQSMGLSKFVTDCDIAPGNTASDATKIGRYAYGITENGNYVFKYDTMDGQQEGSMDSWKLVKRSLFYAGITSICYDPNGTQANTRWPDLHTDTSEGVIIITVKSTSGIGPWGGQIIILGPDLIEYGRYNINYPTDRPHDDGMMEHWLGINQPETGDYSRFQCYKDSRGHGIGDMIITAPNNNTSRTLWISIWGPHKISVSNNLIGNHYTDASKSAGSNLFLEGSFRVLWKYNLGSAWPTSEGLLMENASPPCHGNRPSDEDITEAGGDGYADVNGFDTRAGVWTHPGYYFVPRNALFHTVHEDWVGLICKVAHRESDNFIRNSDEFDSGVTQDGTSYTTSKPIMKQHWEDFDISIVSEPTITHPNHASVGDVLRPLKMNTFNGANGSYTNGNIENSPDHHTVAPSELVREVSDLAIVTHRLRNLRNGNVTIGSGALEAEPYGVIWDMDIPGGGGVATWKSWASHEQGGEHSSPSFRDYDPGLENETGWDGSIVTNIRKGMCNNVNSFRYSWSYHTTDGYSSASGETSNGNKFHQTDADYAAEGSYSATVEASDVISDTVGFLRLSKGMIDSNFIAQQGDTSDFYSGDNLENGTIRTCFNGAGDDAIYGGNFYEGSNNMDRLKYPAISVVAGRSFDSSTAANLLYVTTENTDIGKANFFVFDLPSPQTATGHDRVGSIASLYAADGVRKYSMCANLMSRYTNQKSNRTSNDKPLIWPLVLRNAVTGSEVGGQFKDVFQWLIAGKGESKAYKAFVNEDLTTLSATSEVLGYTFDASQDRDLMSSYCMLHQSDSLIGTGTDIVTMELSSNNDNSWVGNHGLYRYKLSAILDGYQESAMGLQKDIQVSETIEQNIFGTTIGESDAVKSSVRVLITVQCIDDTYTLYNTRLSGYDIYRANIAEDGSQITEYQLAHTIKFSEDEGSKSDETLDSGGTLYYRTWAINDYGTAGAGFGAITGLPETLNNVNLNYRLSTTIGSYHFVGGVYIQETGEKARNGIFRSKPAKFDVFDWSNDWLLLPDEPMAIQGFLGRLYAFSTKETFVIDPNTMQILDTFAGGVIGQRSVAVSEQYGMCYANRNGVYLHNGTRSSLISEKIYANHDDDLESRTNSWKRAWDVIDSNLSGGDWGGTTFQRFRLPQVYWHGEKDCFIISMGYRDSSTGYNGAFVYTPATGKWTRIFPDYMQAACQGERDELLYISGRGKPDPEGTVVAVRQLQKSSNFKVNNNMWFSQKLTMGMPTTEKIFTKLKIAGNFENNIPNFSIMTDKGTITSSDITIVDRESTDKLKVYKLKGGKRTARWIRVQLGDSTVPIVEKSNIESLSIIYRPKKRI